jgi:hypothetical protein
MVFYPCVTCTVKNGFEGQKMKKKIEKQQLQPKKTDLLDWLLAIDMP